MRSFNLWHAFSVVVGIAFTAAVFLVGASAIGNLIGDEARIYIPDGSAPEFWPFTAWLPVCYFLGNKCAEALATKSLQPFTYVTHHKATTFCFLLIVLFLLLDIAAWKWRPLRDMTGWFLDIATLAADLLCVIVWTKQLNMGKRP